MNQNVLKGILAGVSVAALFGSTAAFAASPDTTPQGVGGGVLNPTASVTNPVKALGAGLDGRRHVGQPLDIARQGAPLRALIRRPVRRRTLILHRCSRAFRAPAPRWCRAPRRALHSFGRASRRFLERDQST